MVLLVSLLGVALAASPAPEPRIVRTEVAYVQCKDADAVKQTLDVFQPPDSQ
jgi:hypothetical protein